MSLKAICQLVLYFQSFKNIDLGQQGIYTMKARIKSNDQYSPPHRNFESKLQLRSRKKNKIREQAELQDNEYKTKSFLIRYNDEEIDLEEIVVFRIQLETLPEMEVGDIYLHVDLYYAHDINYGFDVEKHRELNFEKIDSLKVKLNNVERGMASYAPVTFSSNYKSTIRLFVFSMMMDMKFRTWKLFKKEKTERELEREKMSSLKEYFEFYVKRSSHGESGFYRKYIKTLIEFSEQAKRVLLKTLRTKIEYKYQLPKYCLADKETSLELVEVQPKTYMQYINMYKIQNYNPKMFHDEVQQISIENHIFFQNFLIVLQEGNLRKEVLIEKEKEWKKERFGEFIFRSEVKQDDLSGEKCSVKEKEMLAKKIRNKKGYFQNLDAPEIESTNIKLPEHPIIFHEVTEVNKEKFREYEMKNQMFVLSHGFQGSSDDMVTIKNNIKIYYPKAVFLLARSNEGQTDGDIGKMGERIAKQIQDFIADENIDSGLVIHFVGHSLGGIILRASLKHLDKYKNNFGTYISLSSPHLSYLNGTKTSIQTGLWVIKKWKKIQSIDQMTMSDNKNLEQTFMFKLSKEGSLKDFHRIVLVGSPEDSYVPWHSARIHRSSNWSGQSIALENMMTNNILSNKVKAIHRIGVDFFISERNIDSVIGRAAHIRFLSDETVLEMMLSCIPELFQ